MTLQREAMSLSDFERQERGLPPKKRVVVPQKDPVAPVVDDQVNLDDLPNLEIVDISARRKNIRNSEGVLFTGYDLYIKFSDDTEISGWTDDGAFQKLRLRIPKERIDLIQKIEV